MRSSEPHKTARSILLSLMLFIIGIAPSVLAIETKANASRPVDGMFDSLDDLSNRMTSAYESDDQNSRFKRIAVVPFKNLGPNEKKYRLGEVVSEILAQQFTSQKKFVVIERSRIKTILNELALAEMGIVDETTAQEIGSFIGAQALVTGTVGRLGTDYVVNVRMVNVKTAKVLISDKVSLPAKNLETVSSEVVVKRSRSGAIFRSMVFPGWGQLYNDQDIKGYIMIGLAGSLLAATATTFTMGMIAENEYKENKPETVGKRETANDLYLTSSVLLASYGAIWIYGMIDAAIFGKSYESVDLEEMEESTAFLHPALPTRPTPFAAYLQGGAYVGMTFSF